MHDREITGVDQVHLIVPSFFKAFDDHSGNLFYLLKGDILRDLEKGVVNGKFFPSVKIIPLFSDEDKMKFFIRKLIQKFMGMIDHIRIIAAAKPFVCGDEDEANLIDFTLDQKGLADRRKRGGQGLPTFL